MNADHMAFVLLEQSSHRFGSGILTLRRPYGLIWDGWIYGPKGCLDHLTALVDFGNNAICSMLVKRMNHSPRPLIW